MVSSLSVAEMSISFAFVVYLVGAVLLVGFVIGLAILLYMRAAASRKHYTCPQCGEQQTVELMAATHCNACGAPFSENSN